MKILVLGGTVFLSAEIAREGLRRGHEVTCLARGTSSQPPDGVTWVSGDRDDGPDVYPVERWDAVVDVTRHPRYAREALQALGGDAAHWTLVSSASVYADHSVPGATESAELLPPSTAELMESMETYGECKVACEDAVLAMVGERAHIGRAGLIAGPGDVSDRFGYWPARFARNGDDRVLVPDVSRPTQVISVGDVATWILDGAEGRVVGVFNAVGDVLPLTDMFDLIQTTVGHTGEQVRVDEDWLAERGVEAWSGENSLPLWLPAGDYDGFSARSNAAARDRGMRLSNLEELISDTIAYERQLGLERNRSAGLETAREVELLRAWEET